MSSHTYGANSSILRHYEVIDARRVMSKRGDVKSRSYGNLDFIGLTSFRGNSYCIGGGRLCKTLQSLL